jgi:hypothetical protein
VLRLIRAATLEAAPATPAQVPSSPIRKHRIAPRRRSLRTWPARERLHVYRHSAGEPIVRAVTSTVALSSVTDITKCRGSCDTWSICRWTMSAANLRLPGVCAAAEPDVTGSVTIKWQSRSGPALACGRGVPVRS